MTGPWWLEVRGGAYDGWALELKLGIEPPPMLFVWICSDYRDQCPGHAAFDANDPNLDLITTEAYRRVDIDQDERRAFYELGDTSPDHEVETFELVGAGGALEPV